MLAIIIVVVITIASRNKVCSVGGGIQKAYHLPEFQGSVSSDFSPGVRLSSEDRRLSLSTLATCQAH